MCGQRESNLQCWTLEREEFTVDYILSGATMLGSFACGLYSAGIVYCWNEGELDESLMPPAYAGFAQVSAGNGHVCAVFEDGIGTCWGSNEFGESNVPEVELSAIAAGSDFSCGITADSTEVICWGDAELEVVNDVP